MTLRITIRYSAQARQAVGQDAEVVDLDRPSTVADLLTHLAERHPNASRLLLAGDGRPQSALLVFVADEQVGVARMLKDGEVVSILPPIAGG